jgi:hypothetical protein
MALLLVKPDLRLLGTKAFASTCAQRGEHMIQNFREQAERAERLARGVNDARTCEALLKYARECREKFEAKAVSEVAPKVCHRR